MKNIVFYKVIWSKHLASLAIHKNMAFHIVMTSSNGDIFCITDVFFDLHDMVEQTIKMPVI